MQSDATTQGTGSEADSVKEAVLAPLDLRAIDRALAPLRRVLAYAVQPGTEVAYLGLNGVRAISSAAAVPGLPAAVSSALHELAFHLRQLDDLPPEEREAGIGTAHQLTTRLDAVLGLPLPAEPRPPSRARSEPRERKRGGARREPAPADAPHDDATLSREPAFSLATQLEEIGVQPSVAAALAEAGVYTAYQLLMTRPVEERVYSPVHGAGRELPVGEEVAVGGRIAGRWSRITPSGEVTSYVVVVGADRLVARWARVFPAGLELVAVGTKAVLIGHATEGEVGMVRADVVGAAVSGEVRSMAYGLPVADASIREALRVVLARLAGVDDILSGAARSAHHLPALGEALGAVHTTGSARPVNRRRLGFDELVMAQVGRSYRRFQGSSERGYAHGLLHGKVATLLKMGEAEDLTDSQATALEDVKRDLLLPVPMQRLVCGPAAAQIAEVGTWALTMVAEATSQVLWIAPDSHTASLRFAHAEPRLRALGLKSLLLQGTPWGDDVEALRRGEIHVVFATPEALDHDLDFRRLGLVVAEEQGDHGGVGAAIAKLRSPRPDLLLLVEGPPSPELLLTAYGALDLSWVTAPERRLRPAKVWPEEALEIAFAHLQERVLAGGQALVALPLARSGGDLLDSRETAAMVATLQEQVFPGARIGVLHGADSPADQLRVWDELRTHRLDVVVATTRVETLPTFPRELTLLVEHADRVDSNRLLSLRALVAGGEINLVAGAAATEAGRAKVEAFAQAADDRTILDAHPDPLTVEPMIAAASVLPRFTWADPSQVRDVVGARVVAHEVLRTDPSLARGAHVHLARAIEQWWSRMLDTPQPLPRARAGAPKRRRRRRRRR